MNATSSMPVDLSVIVPAYNEAARIDYGVHAIMDYPVSYTHLTLPTILLV